MKLNIRDKLRWKYALGFILMAIILNIIGGVKANYLSSALFGAAIWSIFEEKAFQKYLLWEKIKRFKVKSEMNKGNSTKETRGSLSHKSDKTKA